MKDTGAMSFFGSLFDMTIPTGRRQFAHIMHKLEKIMSAISDYAAKVRDYHATVSAALDGIAGDIQLLLDKIKELQNTPGQITPEDQKLLDDIQAGAQALADKASGLDAQNPPPAPPG